MASLDDVRRLALALPETSEKIRTQGDVHWRVKDKLFVWERPLRKSDLAALGDAAPTGTILGVRVADVGVKEVLVEAQPEIYFTTPHFSGYPAVLVKLDTIDLAELEEIIVEAWLNRAPARLAKTYLEAEGSQSSGRRTPASEP
jgi:hypothetical protein